jgi:hypothetical protein
MGSHSLNAVSVNIRLLGRDDLRFGKCVNPTRVSEEHAVSIFRVVLRLAARPAYSVQGQR